MTVWLCSGQGAQKPGMGADLLDIPEVADTFAVMSEGLGLDLKALACEGTAEDVNETKAAQALTMAVSVGVGRALKAWGCTPTAIIGFSLGQISALVLAEILSLEDATALLKVRSETMAAACAAQEGGMVALMGASLDEAEQLCAETVTDLGSGQEATLVCANHNAPGQIVISGHTAALERAQEIWKEAGKRSVRLATSGAFHSPLMAPAAREVETFCKSINFNEPAIILICNTDAQPFVVEEASRRLGAQVENGVLFEQSVRAMLDSGETTFVEVGFGGVLANLVKRIDRSTQRTCVGDRQQWDAYLESL